MELNYNDLGDGVEDLYTDADEDKVLNKKHYHKNMKGNKKVGITKDDSTTIKVLFWAFGFLLSLCCTVGIALGTWNLSMVQSLSENMSSLSVTVKMLNDSSDKLNDRLSSLEKEYNQGIGNKFTLSDANAMVSTFNTRVDSLKDQINSSYEEIKGRLTRLESSGYHIQDK